MRRRSSSSFFSPGPLVPIPPLLPAAPPPILDSDFPSPVSREAGKIQIIREYGRLDTEEYREDGIYVEAAVPAAYVGKVMG